MPVYRGPLNVWWKRAKSDIQYGEFVVIQRSWLIFTYLFCCDLVVTLGRKKFVSPTLARWGGGEPGYMTGKRSLVGLACCTINWGMTKFFGRFGDRNSLDGGSMSMDICTVGGRGMGRTTAGVLRLGRPISNISGGRFEWLAVCLNASDGAVTHTST